MAQVLPGLAHAIGNRATGRLLSRSQDRKPRARKAPGGSDVLEIRSGEILVAKVTVRGGARSLERVSIRDLSESRAGRITHLDIEVLHPVDVDVEVHLEPGAAGALLEFGIDNIEITQTGAGTPVHRSENEIWPPPMDSHADGPGRILTDAEELRRRNEERRRARRLKTLRRQLVHLTARVGIDKDLHEDLIHNKEDQPVVSFFADLIGGADLPDREIWEETDDLLEKAQRALDAQDPGAAAKYLEQARAARQKAQKALGIYRKRTISGAESAVEGLEKVRTAGDVASTFVPGPWGSALSAGNLLGESIGEAIFDSDPVEQQGLDIPIMKPGGPRTRLPRGKEPLRPGRSRLREYDMDVYSTFRNRRGDKLAGHEMLQNLWLKTKHLAGRRGTGRHSRDNPAVALSSRMHTRVGVEQRRLGLFNKEKVAKMTATENIELNALAMKRAGVPDYVIETLKKEALRHAGTLPAKFAVPVP